MDNISYWKTKLWQLHCFQKIFAFKRIRNIIVLIILRIAKFKYLIIGFFVHTYMMLILKSINASHEDKGFQERKRNPPEVSNPFLRRLFAGQPPCAYTHVENNRATSTIKMHNMNQLRRDNYGSNKSQMRSSFIRPRATLRRSLARAMPTQLNDSASGFSLAIVAIIFEYVALVTVNWYFLSYIRIATCIWGVKNAV